MIRDRFWCLRIHSNPVDNLRGAKALKALKASKALKARFYVAKNAFAKTAIRGSNKTAPYKTIYRAVFDKFILILKLRVRRIRWCKSFSVV